MTPEQERALLSSRIIFGSLDAADGALIRSDGAFTQALVTIRALLDTLPPPGDLMRDKAWKEMRPHVLTALEPWSQALGRETINAIVDQAPAQAGHAYRYSATAEAAGVTDPATLAIGPSSTDLPGASAARRAAGDFSQNARSIEPANARMVPISSLGATQMEAAAAEFMLRTPDSVAQIVAGTRVNQASLSRMFGASATGSTLGQEHTGFARFAYESIDARVRTGLLRGDTTEEIAREILFDEVRGKMRLGPTANRLKAYAQTAARTALADSARLVHEAVWDANNVEGLGLVYEFDASMDSRTCPTCAPLDGARNKDRSALPKPPLHPRCRCLLVVADPDEDAAKETQRATRLIDESELPPRREGESKSAYSSRLSAEGYYVTKIQGQTSGARWYRQAVDVEVPGRSKGQRRQPSSQIHFLASDQASTINRQEAFGGGAAGAKRGALFKRWVDQGMDPEQAYQQLTHGTQGARSFVSLKELQQRGITLPDAKQILDPTAARRKQQAAAAAAKEAKAAAARLSPPSRPVKQGFSTEIGSPRTLIQEGTAIAKPVISNRTAGYAREAAPLLERHASIRTTLARRANGVKLASEPPSDQLIAEAKVLRQQIGELEAKGARGMNTLRKELMRSDLNVVEANTLAGGITYRNGAGAWAGDVREFALMFNGRGLYRSGNAWTATITNTRRRGHFDPVAKAAHASSRRVLFHEIGHGLEVQDPAILQAATTWRGIRADSDRTKTLKAITGVSGYRNTEKALTDAWINPYVGKVYPGDRYSEVITMGIEHFADPAAMFRLYARDPDHFHLIVALTRKAYR